MKNEYLASVAADCRRRAELLMRSARFIEARCAPFSCVCAHDDGHVHLYDESDCKREFGEAGWEVQSVCFGEELVGKLVDGVNVTFRRPLQHAFVPTTPSL